MLPGDYLLLGKMAPGLGEKWGEVRSEFAFRSVFSCIWREGGRLNFLQAESGAEHMKPNAVVFFRFIIITYLSRAWRYG